MGKYSHVHPFGLLDQSIDRIPGPELPRALLRVADEDLRDALLAREPDDLADGIASLPALDDVNLGAQLPREFEILLDRFLGLPREFALFHVDRQQLPVKPAAPRARRFPACRARCCAA